MSTEKTQKRINNDRIKFMYEQEPLGFQLKTFEENMFYWEVTTDKNRLYILELPMDYPFRGPQVRIENVIIPECECIVNNELTPVWEEEEWSPVFTIFTYILSIDAFISDLILLDKRKGKQPI